MKKDKKIAGKEPRYVRWASVLALLVFAVFLISKWRNRDESVLITPAATTVAPASGNAQSSSNKLEGKWQRSDGGYVLELSGAQSNGDIKASYFNPNPINVGRSLWQNNAGKLMVMVELQDKNYPGSVYNLEYVESQNRLKGTYFQAVEQMTYNVEFTRLN
jgi:uncharacterized protein (DUF2147 family)